MGRILSGVQPTGRDGPHLGNYLGAFSQWAELAGAHESFFCIVDLHSMTQPWNPTELRDSSRSLAALLIASGIDPARSPIFLQSDVGAHTELAWILTCLSRLGELRRMTQFKEKGRGKEAGGIGAGLLMYPVLMAADVLAYRADLVPVGEDQRQHLELMRELARRFNREFGEVFPEPDAWIPEHGARVMSLDDPTQKMSKSSERPTGQIWMLDAPDAIRKKVGRAVTDSGNEIRNERSKPAISNLLTIFAAASGKEITELEKTYDGAGYAQFKSDLADAVIERLAPIQDAYKDLIGDGKALDALLDEGADRARTVTSETLGAVRKKVGLRA